MTIVWNKDTKTLAGGAAAALACGIMLGGMMKPDFGDDGRPAGPQMIAGWSGVRSTGPFDPGISYASYAGQVPDYVVGTDWKKTMAWPDERAAVPAPAQQVAARDEGSAAEPDDAWAKPLTRAAYEDPAAPKARYPSLGAGTAAPASSDDNDDEEPVVVTG